MPNIYAISDVPPEIQAYAMAKYSRSGLPLHETLRELSEQRTEKFLNTFYFSYGHASIADLAHIALAIEDISLLSSMEIVDEPLWDGQERSTRYQSFDQAPYYRPSGATEPFDESVVHLFSYYQTLYQETVAAFSERFPQPNDLSQSQWQRTIAARSFDVARYALPLATLTSLGQITSARVLERQISRLMASTSEETQNIARAMKQAATEDIPFNLLIEKWKKQDITVPQAILDQMNLGPVTPTLTKYTEPNQYLQQTGEYVERLASDYFPHTPAAAEASVTLHEIADPLNHALSTLFYQHSAFSYQDIINRVEDIPTKEKQEIISHVFALRGAHDEWLSAFRHGPLVFDIVTDVGAMRDLNRHRRIQKILQPIHPQLGYTTPEFLSNETAYQGQMNAHYQKVATLPLNQQAYVLPLAHQRRMLMQMDLAEAAYIIELRSRSSGHFSYRAIANQMYHALTGLHPLWSQYIRVTPYEAFDFFAR